MWLLLATLLGRTLTTDVNPPKPPKYACEVRQKGYHMLEREVCGVLIWKDSLADQKPLEVNFPRGKENCRVPFKTMLKKVEAKLGLTDREPYQQPWRYFTPQGDLVTTEAEWDDAALYGPIMLIEGGQWQWPPVKVGFRHPVRGLIVDGRQIELETLAIRPPIFSIANLVNEQETEELIEYTKPKFKRSSVVYMDKDVGKDVNEFRTSVDYRPRPNETALVAKFEARAAAVSRIPHAHQEAMQVLQYQENGFYHAHDDASNLRFYAQNEPQILRYHYGHFDRMITLFWYLNTVEEGGETNFPMADNDKPVRTMKKCEQGLMVKAVRGNAVMWYNMHPGGLVSKYALHGACNVKQGQKYGINAWIYNKPFGTRPAKTLDPNHPRLLEIRGGKAVDEDISMKRKKKKAVQPQPEELAEEEADPKRQLNILNQLGAPADVYYENGGDGVFMFALGDDEQSGVNTFAGHQFSVRTKSGETVGIYTVKDSPMAQIFRAKPKGKSEL